MPAWLFIFTGAGKMGALELSFFLYLFFLLGIGVYAYRFSRNLEDFILAGRRLGPWVVALSAQASDMSGWLLLGLPGEAFKQGLSVFWVAIGCLLGTYFNWAVISRRLRSLSEKLGALTLPDLFEARFGGSSGFGLRLASLLVVVIFYALYISAQFKAAGKTLSSTFALSYHQALVVGGGVIILYTLLGGFFAVAWTDLFQGILMVCVAVGLPALGIWKLGGVGDFFAHLSRLEPNYLSPSRGLVGWSLVGGLIIGGLAWGLGYPGQPHIVVRFMAIRKERELRNSMLIAMVWVILALYGSIFVGFIARAYLGSKVSDPETSLILLAQRLFPGWFAGLAIAGISAAIMSTVDSQILVLTSALVEDFYRRFLKKDASERLSLFLSRACTLLVGVSAIFLAWNVKVGVFKYVQYAWGGLAAGFGPALIATLYFKRATGWGVASGMLVGIATILVWHNIPALAGLVWELVPAFFLSLLVIVLVSKLSKIKIWT